MYKPNFNLRVTNIETAKDLFKEKWPDKAVSLLDPIRNRIVDANNNTRIGVQGKHHLYVPVDDITFKMSGYEVPTVKHAEKVLSHTADIEPGDNVLIHCYAGISRSTATAIAVLVQHGAMPNEAFDYVEHIRPILDPNELMIINYDKVLGLDGDLHSAYEEWANEKPRLLLSRLVECYTFDKS